MNATQLRMAGAGLFLLAIFLFGFWLTRSGKPYNLAIFTIHKLIVVGALIFLAITIYNVHRVTPLNPIQLLAAAVTVVCFLATMATGALLSLDKVMPDFVLRLHQITPYLTVVSTAAMLYLVLVGGGELIKT